MSGIKRTTAQAQPGQALQEPEVALDEHLMKRVGNSISLSFQTALQPILLILRLPKKWTLVPVKHVWCMQKATAQSE